VEEAHDIYVQFEDGTFTRLPAMHEADKVYQYYERKHARQREGVRSCWVVRPSDHQVVLGKAPANWHRRTVGRWSTLKPSSSVIRAGWAAEWCVDAQFDENRALQYEFGRCIQRYLL
jgi:hypothetical protein